MTLIFPMFALVLLTTVVGVLTGFARIRGAYAGEVDPRYFKLMSQYKISDRIASYGRNFDNLFEVPVLFYAVCATALALQLSSPMLQGLAWAFVALRVLHSAIHITYNNPMHRFVPFILSFFCVLAMWITLVVSVSWPTA